MPPSPPSRLLVGPEGFDEGDDEDGPMIVDLSVPFVSFS